MLAKGRGRKEGAEVSLGGGVGPTTPCDPALSGLGVLGERQTAPLLCLGSRGRSAGGLLWFWPQDLLRGPQHLAGACVTAGGGRAG